MASLKLMSPQFVPSVTGTNQRKLQIAANWNVGDATLALDRALEPLHRFDDLGPPGLRFLTLFALAIDDLFRRTLEKIGLGELGIDALDVGVDLGHLFLQPCSFGCEIDDALERKCCHLSAHDKL